MRKNNKDKAVWRSFSSVLLGGTVRYCVSRCVGRQRGTSEKFLFPRHVLSVGLGVCWRTRTELEIVQIRRHVTATTRWKGRECVWQRVQTRGQEEVTNAQFMCVCLCLKKGVEKRVRRIN